VIEAGSSPGLADLGIIAHTGLSARFDHVPPETYCLRVRARRGGGGGNAADEVVLVVP